MKVLLRCASLLLLLWGHNLGAEALVNHLYQARVPLPERGQAAQQQAIREGFAQVLVKVSGFSGTAEFAGVAEALQSADRYLLEFAIESEARPAADGVSARQGEALWMRFNQQQIDTFIRRWEIPVWPSSRPQIELTLHGRLGDQWVALDANNYPAVATLLSNVAYARGVHLSLRSPDQTPGVADYQGQLNISRDPFGAYTLTLELSTAGREFLSERTIAATLPQALNQIMGTAVDRMSLAQSYVATAVGGGDQVTLELRGVRSFAAYQRALDSLRTLEMVDAVQVLQLDAEGLEVQVKLASDLRLLLDAIAQQGVLAAAPGTTPAAAGPGSRVQLDYRGP